MKAKRYIYEEVSLGDGSSVFMIVWELPEPTWDRPHGYKYRLNYYTNEGVSLVRYDNRRGKGITNISWMRRCQ